MEDLSSDEVSARVLTSTPHVVSDRNLYTGQNPASSGPLAQEVLAALS